VRCRARFAVWMRFLTRCLWCALWAVVGLAQDGGVVRVLASGTGGDIQERFRVARDAEQWQVIVREEGLDQPAVAVDYAQETVVVLWYGSGRGGTPQVHTLESLRPNPNHLVRIEGEVGGKRVPGRWVVLGIPVHWEPWRTTTWFETDAIPMAGAPVWRAVLPARSPFAIASLGEVAADPGAEALLFGDAVSFRQFWRERALGAPIPAYDFSQLVVLVVRGAPPSLYTMNGPKRSGNEVRPWTILRRWQLDSKEVLAAGPTFRWFAVPRHDGVFDFELPVAGDASRVRVVERFDATKLLGPTILPVFRVFEGEIDKRQVPLCGRATTLAEWRALRAQLDGPALQLPDDWANFEHECIVVLATDEARVWPGFGLSVSEEEGVDVVTVTEIGPSGRDPGVRSQALVLKVPRRKGQMSIVFRRDIGPAPGHERTLRVFPGF
jgi:hypothetical protein